MVWVCGRLGCLFLGEGGEFELTPSTTLPSAASFSQHTPTPSLDRVPPHVCPPDQRIFRPSSRPTRIFLIVRVPDQSSVRALPPTPTRAIELVLPGRVNVDTPTLTSVPGPIIDFTWIIKSCSS